MFRIRGTYDLRRHRQLLCCLIPGANFSSAAPSCIRSKQKANIITCKRRSLCPPPTKSDRFGFLHIDLNSFFASVEQQLNPEYRGLPLAVVPTKADTTCCIAASYEAKAFGIKTGTQVGEAKKICPSIILIEGSHTEYAIYSKRIAEAVELACPVAHTPSHR